LVYKKKNANCSVGESPDEPNSASARAVQNSPSKSNKSPSRRKGEAWGEDQDQYDEYYPQNDEYAEENAEQEDQVDPEEEEAIRRKQSEEEAELLNQANILREKEEKARLEKELKEK